MTAAILNDRATVGFPLKDGWDRAVKNVSSRVRTFADKPLAKTFAKAAFGIAGTFAAKTAAVSLAASAGSGAVLATAIGGAAVTTYSAVKDYRQQLVEQSSSEQGFWANFKGFFSFLGQNKWKYTKKMAMNSGLAVVGGAGVVEALDSLVSEAHAYAPINLDKPVIAPESLPDFKIFKDAVNLEVNPEELLVAPSVDTLYEVQKTDNLWNIVKEHYPELSDAEIASKIEGIVDLNDIEDAGKIYPGQTLNLGGAQQVVEHVVSEPPTAEQPMDTQDEAIEAEAVDEPYQVQNGDSLWNIVREHYSELSDAGIASKIEGIVALNDIEDAGKIYPGQVLQLGGAQQVVEHVVSEPEPAERLVDVELAQQPVQELANVNQAPIPANDVLTLQAGEYGACDARSDANSMGVKCVFNSDLLKVGQSVPVSWDELRTNIDIYFKGEGSSTLLAESEVVDVEVLGDTPPPIDCLTKTKGNLIELSCKFDETVRYMDGADVIDFSQSTSQFGLQFDYKRPHLAAAF